MPTVARSSHSAPRSPGHALAGLPEARGSCAAARPARGVWYARSVRPARYPRSAAAILSSVPQRDRALLLRLGLDLDNPAHAEFFVEGVRAADDAIADQVRWEREQLG